MTAGTGVARDTAALDEFVGTLAVRVRREIARIPAAQPAASLAEAGGKHLRARLLWLSAAAVAPRTVISCPESILRAATAIELAHLGSLIHDDIVDGATTRRGVASVHVRSGIDAAYRAGTTLLHLASALVADFPAACRMSLARAILAMCRGQVRELMGLYSPCSRGERLAIVRDKTAALLEATASMGAIVVGGSVQQAKALRTFARALGIAYQIKDDLMDLVGNPARLGRANGSDLWDGVMTLPVLIARERSKAVALMLQRIHAQRAAADVATCIQLIRESGAIETANGQARCWAAVASRVLRGVPLEERIRVLLSAFVDKLTQVELATQVVVETPVRRGTVAPLHFQMPDAGNFGVRASHNHPADNKDCDSLVLRHLVWIEPTLAEMTSGLMQEWTSSHRPARSIVPATVAAALRATELARSIASSRPLAPSPTEWVAAADCLDAVAFACLAEAPATLHAGVEEMQLASFDSARPRQKTLSERVRSASSPP